MTRKSRYGLLLCLILILCVFLAGCSSQNTTIKTTPVPTTPAAKYTAGDIVAMTASSQSEAQLIVSYDASKDQYERALVVKTSGGTWGYPKGTSPSPISRVDMEKVYPVLITHVSVASVAVVTPTVPTTVTTTPSGSGPIMTAISPTNGVSGTSVTITITGSNFQTGATVRMTQPGLQPVTATGVSVSSTQITCTFALGGLNAGTANIQVTNPDSRSSSMMSVFTIGAAPPVITSISPTKGTLGASAILTLKGQNLDNVVSVILVSADGLQPGSCTSVSSASTAVTCTYTIMDSATTEVYNLEAINSDGGVGWLNSSFTINNATS
ncbi:IPT/TIG domain-containing protein [Methanoregula sp.]|uniref:IPT/TIG domain-containing protein n=1 Tax=Methanoregula sp. TaxID=2052170 RepID=UPI003BAFD8AA